MQYKICHTYGMNAISMKYIPMRYDIHTSFVAVLSLLLRAGSGGGGGGGGGVVGVATPPFALTS